MSTSPLAPRTSQQQWRLHAILTGIVALILLGASAMTLHLWPDASEVPVTASSPGAAADRAAGDAAEVTNEIHTVRVTSVTPVPCMQGVALDPESGSAEPSSEPAEAHDCFEVRATLPVGKPMSFTVDALRADTLELEPGDKVRVMASSNPADKSAAPHYSFYDYPRGGKMLAFAVVFALIVIFVGRWRGALSLVGVAAAITFLVTFILPAILAGKPPIFVAVTGSIGIMVIVLYLAHGISHRTTAALFGAIFGILFTAVAGYGVTRWLRFSGIGSTEDASLWMAVPDLQMNDVLTATIVIAGLGILNDVTVAQASAVWEMRELNPHLSKRRIYLSAMRVGRDHIASSIYTLVFAYAGAMLVVLLLLYTHPRDLIDLVTSEQIGQEVVRTLVGATGLVLSMPVTTWFAVLFAKEPASAESRGDH